MRPSAALARRLIGVAALPAALVVTAGLVTASSYSVFSGTTTSPNNSFSTGSVVMKNDSSGTQAQSGSALFTVPNLAPNSASTTKCVTVQSSGTLASVVKLYVQNATSSNTLAQYIDVKVEVGTSGSTCASFTASSTVFSTATLSSFESTYPSYGSGFSTGWSPNGSGTETRAFRFTVGPDASMTNAQQNQSHSVDFVWEADNS